MRGCGSYLPTNGFISKSIGFGDSVIYHWNDRWRFRVYFGRTASGGSGDSRIVRISAVVYSCTSLVGLNLCSVHPSANRGRYQIQGLGAAHELTYIYQHPFLCQKFENVGYLCAQKVRNHRFYGNSSESFSSCSMSSASSRSRVMAAESMSSYLSTLVDAKYLPLFLSCWIGAMGGM
jgi:hypothetical protein